MVPAGTSKWYKWKPRRSDEILNLQQLGGPRTECVAQWLFSSTLKLGLPAYLTVLSCPTEQQRSGLTHYKVRKADSDSREETDLAHYFPRNRLFCRNKAAECLNYTRMWHQMTAWKETVWKCYFGVWAMDEQRGWQRVCMCTVSDNERLLLLLLLWVCLSGCQQVQLPFLHLQHPFNIWKKEKENCWKTNLHFYVSSINTFSDNVKKSAQVKTNNVGIWSKDKNSTERNNPSA